MWSVLLASVALAQDGPEWDKKSFLVAASEKEYAAAMDKAIKLSLASKIRIDTRGVGFDPAHLDAHGGLSLSPESCEGQGWGYPCYVARGRWDTGTYISVEHTSAIEGFTPGLYVVIVATGEAKDLKSVLTTVKATVPDAYLKSAPVYMGCMH